MAMIIAQRIIQKPRKARVCDACGQRMLGPQKRLYGMADPLDKPWVMYVHPECHADKDIDG